MHRNIYILSLLIAFFVVLGLNASAQGEIETERAPDNFNENSFGVVLSSNGWGFNYRFSKRINYRNRWYFESDYDFIKDPKEIKVVNPYFETDKKFVYGKLYSFHQVSAGLGWQKMIFEKRDKGSISLHLFLSTGLTLGIAKPIYYEIVDSTEIVADIQYFFTSIQKLDIEKHSPSDVINKSRFFDGFSEISLIPGAFFKAGMAFDFSRNVMKTNVIEVGASLHAFITPVEIMASNSRYLFGSIFLSYRFGVKYNANINRDARKWARKENR